MSGLNTDLSSKWQTVEVFEPAVITSTTTQATGVSTRDWKRAALIVDVGTITGGGSVTVSISTSATVGGSYAADTDAFVGDEPAAINAAGLYVYNIDVEALSNPFIKVVLTEAGTYSAATSAVIVAEKARY